MAKLTLTDIVTFINDSTAVNNVNTNSTAIENAIENTLSRNGASPNEMGAQLDMNSYRIINLGEPVANSDAARKVDVDNIASGNTSLLSSYKEDIYDHGTVNGAVALNYENANAQVMVMDGAVTLSFSNIPASGLVPMTLILKQDATGSRLVTWPASVIWPNGQEIILSTNANSIDVVTMFTYDGGTTWYVFSVGKNMS